MGRVGAQVLCASSAQNWEEWLGFYRRLEAAHLSLAQQNAARAAALNELLEEDDHDKEVDMITRPGAERGGGGS
jgi:hypothetical protein